ncbi:MAG TPA: polysaccharide biosynthesis protein [Acidobacteriaceae bacterium]|jgi:FlaA1/EpsC-like NDP-sugar epimerase|nr:polysaccharide biosynthesis protein [Acidobacteriaceae bacterium]
MIGSNENYNFLEVPSASSASFAPQSAQDWPAILGRPAYQPASITIPGLTGRTVLVTGAGGFIGSAMVRLLAASGAAEIVLLEIAEQQLFAIFSEMTAGGCGDCCVPVLGSVCDRRLLRALLDEHPPHLILHAAALKHVPLMERNPFAAVATNAIGTWILAELAAECGVPRAVLISTDKAVAPHSIMGASKRIAELATLAHGFTALRLVNVAGSPGSVGPIFAEQIAGGGPITVTHPAARRFFFTLDQVVQLLGEAIEAKDPAGILIPDPGEPLLIEELARRMIAASGRKASILFTEPRPGDKLDESLVGPRERLGDRAAPGLHRVFGPAVSGLEAGIAALESAIALRNLPALLREVERLVPDYEPSALLRGAVSALPSL